LRRRRGALGQDAAAGSGRVGEQEAVTRAGSRDVGGRGARKAAAIVLRPLTRLTKAYREALTEEGERLVGFLRPDAASAAVRFADD